MTESIPLPVTCKALLLYLLEALVVLAGVVGQKLVQVHLLLLFLLLVPHHRGGALPAHRVLLRPIPEAGLGGSARVGVAQRLLRRLERGGAGQAAGPRPDATVFLLRIIKIVKFLLEYRR
jgi:hypothetical protein